MTLRIVQISDSHISRKFPQRTADLEKCIEHINAADPQPDIVIHTGDIADYGLAEQYAIARPVLDKLSAPYYVLAGNRDSRQELIGAFADDNYLAHDAQFIQYSLEQFQTRVLVIDTLFEKKNKGQLCDARLESFEQMLAADTSRPVAVFMHHPPFEASEIPDPFQFEDWADVERFSTLIARYDNIRGVYCGHVHRTIASAVGPVHASAISCLAGDLRKGDVTAAERQIPMFRMLSFS